MQGHYDGELWGVAVSPNSRKVVTCGGDMILRMWDLDSKKMILQSKPFENDIRACDWNGSTIVVGDVKGFIYLSDTNLVVTDKKGSKFS